MSKKQLGAVSKLVVPLALASVLGLAAAETSIPASGTYTDKPTDVILWVLAYPPNDLYYPQSPNACQGVPPDQGNGRWQVPVYLGETGGPPEWFDIVVVLTDGDTSQKLGLHVKEGCEAGQYKGLSAADLEQMVITEKAHITVQTLD